MSRPYRSSQIRLAVITYSRAGSVASVVPKSPLLAQLPFSQPEVIMNELKDHGIELGLGRGTTAGGSAVIEAIVAALEVNIQFGLYRGSRLHG
jgi:hypothetical protein